jgi:hypothetical protein
VELVERCELIGRDPLGIESRSHDRGKDALGKVADTIVPGHSFLEVVGHASLLRVNALPDEASAKCRIEASQRDIAGRARLRPPRKGILSTTEFI